MDKTFQRKDEGSFGSHYLIAPMSDEKVMNKKTCFLVEGTKQNPIGIQSLLPDLTDFTVSKLISIKFWYLGGTIFSYWQCLDDDVVGDPYLWWTDSNQVNQVQPIV